MLHISQKEPPAAADAGLEFAIGLVQWLDDLLDTARDRRDLPMARLIADLMDDLEGTAAKA